jgi:hypothetical protein
MAMRKRFEPLGCGGPRQHRAQALSDRRRRDRAKP